MNLPPAIKHVLTEKNGEKFCPVRTGGFAVLIVLMVYAGDIAVRNNGTNFLDMCKGFAYYIVAWAGAIAGKSKLGADAGGNGQ